VHAGAREGIIAGKSGGIISRYASHCYALLLYRPVPLIYCIVNIWKFDPWFFLWGIVLF